MFKPEAEAQMSMMERKRKISWDNLFDVFVWSVDSPKRTKTLEHQHVVL
jgi:hypothetical protein